MAQHTYNMHTLSHTHAYTLLDVIHVQEDSSTSPLFFSPVLESEQSPVAVSHPILWICGSFAVFAVILSAYVFRYLDVMFMSVSLYILKSINTLRTPKSIHLLDEFICERWINILDFKPLQIFQLQILRPHQRLHLNLFCHFRHKDRLLSKLQILNIVTECGNSTQPPPPAPVTPEGQALVTFAPPSYKEEEGEEENEEEEQMTIETTEGMHFNNTSYFLVQREWRETESENIWPTVKQCSYLWFMVFLHQHQSHRKNKVRTKITDLQFSLWLSRFSVFQIMVIQGRRNQEKLDLIIGTW